MAKTIKFAKLIVFAVLANWSRSPSERIPGNSYTATDRRYESTRHGQVGDIRLIR